MFVHCVTFAVRTFARDRVFSIVKLLGLIIGICACLVVFLIANFQLSFDSFHSDGHRIYRIYTEVTGINPGVYSGAPTAWHSHIKSQFSGVESVCNFHTLSAGVKVPEAARVNDFGRHNRIAIVPPDYFDVFNFYEWIIGSPASALEPPLSVVLTESRAKQYFGFLNLSDIVGREIRYDDSLIVTVSGIVKDVSERTDFDFTDFISFSTIERSWLKDRIPNDSWHSVNSSSQLFIKVTENTSALQIEQQFPNLAQLFSRTFKNSWTFRPRLQPLSDLHFNPRLGIFDHSRSVPERSILYTLVIVALCLLGIGVVNYINLETAQATGRIKEIGIRKALGSSRTELIWQFLIHSLMFVSTAVIIAPIVAHIGLLMFKDFVPPGVEVNFTDPSLFVFILCCFVFVTLLAGLYPALILSSYQPAHAVTNLVNRTPIERAGYIRKGLTIFQFAFSQVLVIVTIAIGMQLDYILDKDLGFSHDEVIFFVTPHGEARDKTIYLRDELSKLPEIEAVSLCTPPPYVGMSATMIFDNGKEMKVHNVLHMGADVALLNVYGIDLVAGRMFSASDSSREYVINETYLRTLGFDDPEAVLGKALNRQYTVVGVVKDFHTRSLHSAIEPVVIYPAASDFVNMKPTRINNLRDVQTLLSKVEGAWSGVFPDKKIEFKFVDDAIKRFYEVEMRTNTLMKLCTGIAILVSCLGLFTMSTLIVIQQRREICIRKIYGGSVNSMVALLSKGLLKHVIIAFFIAIPAAYYIIDGWILNFAYRREPSGWLFVIAGLGTLLTAFFTVSLQTVKAARTNPVKYLRHE